MERVRVVEVRPRFRHDLGGLDVRRSTTGAGGAVINVDGFSVPAATVDIREFNGGPDTTADQRGPILKAVERVQKLGGGYVIFPPGRYQTSPILLPEELQSVEFVGAGPIYSERTKYGVRLVAKDEQDYVLGVSKNSVRLRFRNLNIDCNARAEAGIKFLHNVGDILDFIDLDSLSFYNVADGGAFVASVAGVPHEGDPDGMGGENASVQIRNSIFNLNGLVSPTARGSSIYLRNSAAYMWHVHNTHFFGSGGNHGAVRLIAGDLTVENSEFDNGEVVDVYAESSARLTERDVWSGSGCLHANIEQATLPGLYHQPNRNVFQRVTHKSTAYPPKTLVDNSDKPTTLENVEGYRVEINCTTGKDLVVVSVPNLFINGIEARAALQASRGVVETSPMLQAWSRLLDAYVELAHTGGASPRFSLGTYGAGGYSEMSIVALALLLTGPVDIAVFGPTTGSPGPQTVRTYVEMVDGKVHYMAKFPDGTTKPLAIQD